MSQHTCIYIYIYFLLILYICTLCTLDVHVFKNAWVLSTSNPSATQTWWGACRPERARPNCAQAIAAMCCHIIYLLTSHRHHIDITSTSHRHHIDICWRVSQNVCNWRGCLLKLCLFLCLFHPILFQHSSRSNGGTESWPPRASIPGRGKTGRARFLQITLFWSENGLPFVDLCSSFRSAKAWPAFLTLCRWLKPKNSLGESSGPAFSDCSPPCLVRPFYLDWYVSSACEFIFGTNVDPHVNPLSWIKQIYTSMECGWLKGTAKICIFIRTSGT